MVYTVFYMVMIDSLTLKQQGFVKDLLETKNATEAVLRNYDVGNDDRRNASKLGAQLVKRPNVRAYIESMAQGAAERITKLSETAKSEYVKLEANKDILDRGGYQVKKDITDNRQITINISGESAARYRLATVIPDTPLLAATGQMEGNNETPAATP